ncbi:hypothetical protein [Staphylococcus succinus]|uniref:hypothetical protein n=1 Tax=Staphylococcus succinus TaxID=61015 RepID=UPI00301D09D0
MTNVLENLELVDVEIEEGKATLTFLDESAGEIRKININKKAFDADKSKWIESEEKAQAAEDKAQKHFGTSFDDLEQAIGQRHDIYTYEKFNSLTEVKMTEKFSKDDEGLIFQTEITKVFEDNVGIHIEFEYEGQTYESKMSYSDYLANRKMFLVDPIKKAKRYEQFEQKFNVPIENKDELIGQQITVEVKIAMGKYPYSEIKNIPNRK